MKRVSQVVLTLMWAIILLGCSCKPEIVKVYIPVYPTLGIFDVNITKVPDLNISYRVIEINSTKSVK